MFFINELHYGYRKRDQNAQRQKRDANSQVRTDAVCKLQTICQLGGAFECLFQYLAMLARINILNEKDLKSVCFYSVLLWVFKIKCKRTAFEQNTYG